MQNADVPLVSYIYISSETVMKDCFVLVQ